MFLFLTCFDDDFEDKKVDYFTIALPSLSKIVFDYIVKSIMIICQVFIFRKKMLTKYVCNCLFDSSLVSIHFQESMVAFYNRCRHFTNQGLWFHYDHVEDDYYVVACYDCIFLMMKSSHSYHKSVLIHPFLNE